MSQNQTVDEALAELTATYAYGLNALWVILTGVGIVTMQAGFLALEVGATRAKNVKATLFKNTIDHAVGAVGWYVIGFSLYIGSDIFAAGPDVTWFSHAEFEYPRIFQQYGFAVTSSTIVSGALLSRCRLRVYVVFSFLLSVYIYPIVAHWCWVPGGWLYRMGYLDFAGSGVVHLLGGICAFVGAMACGPRVGRFGGMGDSEHSKNSKSFNENLTAPDEIKFRHRLVNKYLCGSKLAIRFVDSITLNSDPSFHVREAPGHSAPMQCLGAMLLYVAWFSFNAGSSGGMDTIPKVNSASRAAVNTMLAAASGTVSSLLWSDFVRKQYELDLVINGLLSGMVAVTAPCGYCDPWAAILVGILSTPVYVATSKFVIYGLHVDDPIDATAVHMANGMLGVLWTGIVDKNNGLIYTGSPYLLGVQAAGAAAIFAWGFANAFLFFYSLKYFLPYCTQCLPEDNPEDSVKENAIVHSADAQLVGLDFLYYGGSGFPEFDVEAVSEYNATQRIKNKFRAKQVKTMRIFDREQPEGSFHGGDKHISGNYSAHHISGSFPPVLQHAGSTGTVSSTNTPMHSAPASTNNTRAAPL